MKVSLIPRHALLVAIAALLAITPALPAQAPAQSHPLSGEVWGTIVDAQNELPLAGAVVTLDPVAGSPARSARTDAEGRYRFTAVAAGTYRLRVQRLGYLAGMVDVALQGPATAAVSLALRVEPVKLQPIHVVGSVPAAPANPFSARTADAEEAGRARLEAERMRQRTNLAPDVRLVTRADVDAAVPLAESDLFRGLQRLPGVTTRDEYSAELWTRGGAWDHTRVYFDGVPLFNPVHASSLFSGPNTDAVGSVLLFPGAQPLATGGGAAASLELRSRRGGDGGAVAGSGELSLVSGRVAMDGQSGRHRWMLAARRSHLDWMTSQVESRSRGEDIWVTRSFADVAGRYDLRLGGRASVEASALWQRDVLSDGEETDWLRSATPRWGSLAGRAMLRAPVRGMDGRLTVGGSGFGAEVSDAGGVQPRENALISWPTVLATRSGVRHLFAEARVEPPAASGAAPRWSAGIGAARQAVRYAGPPVFPLDRQLPPTLVRDRGALAYGYAWGERRWAPAPGVTLEAGLRAEAGGPAGTVPLRLAPRGAARWQVAPGLAVSAAAGRSWHLLQAGPELPQQSITQHLWLLAGQDVPALRSDVATLGAERWIGDAWLVSVAGYARRSAGVALRDPAPGGVIGREGFGFGRLSAHGAEASARKLAGAWTASASYSWGRATMDAAGFTFPAESDQRHSVDLAAGVRVGGGVRLDAAFTASSGGAFTRFFGGLAKCREGVCEWDELPSTGNPGGLRAPGFASLDLSAEWTRKVGRVQVGAYAQLHNALNRGNPARYQRSIRFEHCGYGTPDPSGGCTLDVYGLGLPRVPLAGLRVAF
ncbi:MAG TPA: TonB-dependent receptor [Longimicrobium sp.]|nr:TonB-dependent receptor [Longimicrobium sp.]